MTTDFQSLVLHLFTSTIDNEFPVNYFFREYKKAQSQFYDAKTFFGSCLKILSSLENNMHFQFYRGMECDYPENPCETYDGFAFSFDYTINKKSTTINFFVEDFIEVKKAINEAYLDATYSKEIESFNHLAPQPTLSDNKMKIDFYDLVLSGFCDPIEKLNLSNYFFRKFKEAEKEDYDSSSFFEGCTYIIRCFEEEINDRYQKRKGDLYQMKFLAQEKQLKYDRDPYKTYEQRCEETIEYCDSELKSVSINDFPLTLNGKFQGYLQHSDINHLKEAIDEAKKNIEQKWDNFDDEIDWSKYDEEGIAILRRKYRKGEWYLEEYKSHPKLAPIAAKGVSAYLSFWSYSKFKSFRLLLQENAKIDLDKFFINYFQHCYKFLQEEEERNPFKKDRKTEKELTHIHIYQETILLNESRLLFEEVKEWEKQNIEIIRKAASNYLEFVRDRLSNINDDSSQIFASEILINPSISQEQKKSIFFKQIRHQLYTSNYKIDGYNFGDEISFIEKMHKKALYQGRVFYSELIHAMPIGEKIADPSKGEIPSFREPIFFRVTNYCKEKINEIEKNDIGDSAFVEDQNWTDCKADTASAKPEELEIEIKPIFDPSAIPDIFELFKGFFSEEDQKILEQILKSGKDASKPLIFLGNGNRLADSFKLLYEKDIITGLQKKELELWIYRNFKYRKGQETKYFSIRYLNDIISTRKDLCRNPILNLKEEKATGKFLIKKA